MKWKCLPFVCGCVLLVLFTRSFAALETYTIDPQHSYVLWQISHFGFSNPSGKWFVNGTVQLDATEPKQSKVNVTINVADIVTGIPELDKHLKDKLFFDVQQFPTATFASDTVEITGKKTARVHGMLTLHGVSKPIVLNITLNKMGENPITNKMAVGFSGTTTLKRSEFGMTTLLPGLGDQVKILLEAEAYQGKQDAAQQ